MYINGIVTLHYWKYSSGCYYSTNSTRYKLPVIKTVPNAANPFDNTFGNGCNVVAYAKSAGISFTITATEQFVYDINAVKSTGITHECKDGKTYYDAVVTKLSTHYGDSTLQTLLASARKDNVGYLIKGYDRYLATKWGVPVDASHPYINTSVTYSGANHRLVQMITTNIKYSVKRSHQPCYHRMNVIFSGTPIFCF